MKPLTHELADHAGVTPEYILNMAKDAARGIIKSGHRMHFLANSEMMQMAGKKTGLDELDRILSNEQMTEKFMRIVYVQVLMGGAKHET